jgi:DNA invertase Pin-like site-specific DNA recombinase
MNAVGYFAEGAKRDGAKRSVGDQNRAFIEFCARQGFEVVATFLDTEGDTEPDAGFRQMIQFLRRTDRGFTVVVVDCVGALGPDLGRAALRMLQVEATGLRLISAQTGSDIARELVDRWADRSEGTPVSERVRSAMRRKAVRGEVLGRPPYGYAVGARRRLELVPEEAVVVRYIFRLYLQEEMGIRKIAGQLNAEGIPTRRGGRWSMISVRDILRNRVYLGTYARFGVRVTNSHPPLISQEDYRRVQDRLHLHTPTETTRTVRPFLLSGMVYCARCGSRLIGVSRRQKWTTKDGEARAAVYRYYQCESRTNQSACQYNTQREAELEARVRELLEEDNPPLVRMIPAGNADSYLLDVMTQVDRVEAKMRRNRRAVEELVADAAHGHITFERMKALGLEHAGEHEALQDELSQARARVAAARDATERRERTQRTRKRLVAEWESLPFHELQAALHEVVERVEVDGSECRLFVRR